MAFESRALTRKNIAVNRKSSRDAAAEMEQLASWSESFVEAGLYKQTPESKKGGDISRFNHGNHNSEPFFRKMQSSFQEAERLRQQCRTAAHTFSSRRQEEKVSLEHIDRSIQGAKEAVDFARAAVLPDINGHLGSPGAPAKLGHLSIPKTIKEVPAVGWTSQGPAAEATLLPADAVQTMLPPLSEETWSKYDPQEAEYPNQKVETPLHASSSFGSSTGEVSPIRKPKAAAEQQDERAAQTATAVAEGQEEDEVSEVSSCEGSSAGEGDWPPKPPMSRFKTQWSFSDRFKARAKKEIEAAAADKEKQLAIRPPAPDQAAMETIQDETLNWVNKFFELSVHTEFHFKGALPIMIMFILDNIYPTKMQAWIKVDWRVQYTASVDRNRAVLKNYWNLVNMEKAKEFRPDSTHLRLEMAFTGTLHEKLDFLRLMKRWHDQRVHNSHKYDPFKRRIEIMNLCVKYGYKVDMPSWVNGPRTVLPEKPMKEQPPSGAFEKMPEFMRLIYFLGSPEHQTM